MDYDKSRVTMSGHKPAFAFSEVKTDDKGLVPVIVQEDSTGEILMLAYMNEEAYNLTLDRGVMTYWSRSRQEL